MSDIKHEKNTEIESLSNRIEALENRLGKLESYLRIEWPEGKKEPVVAAPFNKTYSAEATESKIVEYGLAWLGSVVFLFGIVFLMSWLEGLGYPFFSKVVAYFMTALVVVFSYFSRKTLPTLVYVLDICSYLLLYYITIHLHFFSADPIIGPISVSLILVFIIIAVQLYNAIRKGSEFQATVAITLMVITAIISDATYITLSILFLTAITTHFLFLKKIWWRLHIYSLFLVYLTHFIWVFNNSIMGHPFQAVDSGQHNIWFLFSYAVTYSFALFISKKKLETNGVLISTTLWNALGFSFLLLMIMPTFYQDNYAWIFSGIAAYCLAFAVLLKLRLDRDFAPATFASFSFMALTVAVYGFWGFPDAFFLLVIQSLLVVSIALWFRSRIIVVANALLFITILIIYFLTSASTGLTNFAFAIAALATARILGWQRERLTLKTDMFRNVYLLMAVFMILYSLSEALPTQWVTISWTAAAIGFFLLSIILENIKYRYLSILTIVVTAVRLFFIDLGRMEIQYRVIAFLVFAMISLGVSLYYTKRIRKK